MSSKHRNHKLEEQISQLKNASELDLGYQGLVDQDMEIITKQALRNNKVKKIVFIILYVKLLDTTILVFRKVQPMDTSNRIRSNNLKLAVVSFLEISEIHLFSKNS